MLRARAAAALMGNLSCGHRLLINGATVLWPLSEMAGCITLDLSGCLATAERVW